MGWPSVADYPQGARMAPRVIDDFEFVWMLRGQARFVAGDEELMLSPGYLLLVPPGVRHSLRGTSGTPAGMAMSTSTRRRWADQRRPRSACTG